MQFADQRPADIKNVQFLNIPGSLADGERIARNEALEEDEEAEPEFCAVPSGARRILSRSASGFSPGATLSSWNPYEPTSYGIHQFDVMSVGAGTDGQKTWYYFDGLDWVQGEGSYQDLKNYSNEDINIIFYKGQESLNQCDPNAHIIPASAGRIQCCGDYLLIGLNTDYESRMIYYRDKKMHDFALDDVPQPEQYGKESFVCCNSFFGFTVLTFARSFICCLA